MVFVSSCQSPIYSSAFAQAQPSTTFKKLYASAANFSKPQIFYGNVAPSPLNKRKVSNAELTQTFHPLEKILYCTNATVLSWVPRPVYQQIEKILLYKGAGKPSLVSHLSHFKNQSPPEYKNIVSQIQELRFPSSKGVSNLAWYFPARKGMDTLVYSLGNSQPLTKMGDYLPLMKQGYGFFVYEHPGFGSTAGFPTKETVTQSFTAALDYLNQEKNVPFNRMVAMGYSLGGMVAMEVLSKSPTKEAYPVKAIGLMATFPNFKTFIQEDYLGKACHISEKFGRALQKLFPLSQQVLSDYAMQPVELPVLVLHGNKDDFAWPHRMEQFCKTLSNGQFHLVKGNHCIQPEDSVPIIQTFLDGLP